MQSACPRQTNFPHNTCPTHEAMNAYRDSYWGMSKTFNPEAFAADDLMAWAAKVGFKYVVFAFDYAKAEPSNPGLAA